MTSRPVKAKGEIESLEAANQPRCLMLEWFWLRLHIQNPCLLRNRSADLSFFWAYWFWIGQILWTIETRLWWYCEGTNLNRSSRLSNWNWFPCSERGRYWPILFTPFKQVPNRDRSKGRPPHFSRTEYWQVIPASVHRPQWGFDSSHFCRRLLQRTQPEWERCFLAFESKVLEVMFRTYSDE